MKFTKEHYDSLKKCIEDMLDETGTTIETIKKNYTTLSLSDERFLWDIFWASGWVNAERKHYQEGHYTDNEITTALRKIEKEFRK